MVLVPVPTALAKPVLLMVATEVFEELQVAVLVRFCVLPSLYVPMAVNCCIVPLGIEVLAGVTAIEERTGGVTVNVVEPVTEPEAA